MGLVHRHATRLGLIDVPNARSSHVRPTPSGGGLGIVIAYLSALTCLALYGQTGWAVISTVSAGAAIAVVGFLDDRAHVPPLGRILVHFVGSAWIVYWFGGAPPIAELSDLPGWSLYGSLLTVIGLVWFVNLYNFMDGIDGIAGVEAVSVSLGGAALHWFFGAPESASGPVLLACAAAGFLIWNFPPAKIFMGDVGSGFLGIMLGAMTVQAAWVDSRIFWGWLILLGIFIVDSTLTLLRRLARGERVYEAHRMHGYQHAAAMLGGPRIVISVILLVNLLWLAPIAFLVASGKVQGPIGLVLAYTPLIVAALRLGAGTTGRTCIS